METYPARRMGTRQRILVIVLLLTALAGLATLSGPPRLTAQSSDANSVPGKINPAVFTALDDSPDGSVRVIVHLAAQPSLETAARQADTVQRRRQVYETLRQTAQGAQACLLQQIEHLSTDGHVTAYCSFWIFNGLAATVDRQALETIASRDDVAWIALDRHRQWLNTPFPTPTPQPPTPTPPRTATATPVAGGLEWNVAHINADDVWEELGITGEGVVVANIDTGVFYTHPALAPRYRGYQNGSFDHNYNWFDATGYYPTTPTDGHGHGTHTMGTIVGQDGENKIGVATGAQWIAVKALDDWGYGWDSDIHAAFQWILAPTALDGSNPDPSRAPAAVNNSWGSDFGADTEFQADVQALLSAGIVPVFSAGNDGPASGTIGSPASYPESLSVAATDRYDAIAWFSSRGPSPLTSEIKPDLAAPGVGVRSCWRGGGYTTRSGTSMAAPHVTGLVALMLQANPTLTVAQIETAIKEAAVDLGSHGPDYTYGQGRIDAYQAVLQVTIAGTLTGQVREAGGGAAAGVTITAAPHDGRRPSQTTIDANGFYTLILPAGLYDVTASGYGYLPATVKNVTIVTDETTQQDFTLSLAPRHQLYGTVTEAGTGAPLAATLYVRDTPLSPVQTDPATGAYSVRVAEGGYEVEVLSWGHASARRTVILTQDQRENFSLLPVPPILFVDDGDGAECEYYFTDALDALDQSYDTWTVTSQTEPAAFDLAAYPIVIWTTADSEVNTLSGQAEAALADYLDRGGHLFLSSRGYPLEREWSNFARHYLHLHYAYEYSSITSVNGIDGNPVGAWLGPFFLGTPFYHNSITALYHRDTASAAFIGSYSISHNPTVALTRFDRATCHKVLLFGFPFEALQPADATVVLHRILQWFQAECSIGTLAGRVTSTHTGWPVADATVRATGPRDSLSTVTGDDGRYTLTLTADDYTVSASQAGFTTTTTSGITVAPAMTTTLDVALPPLIAVTPPSLTLVTTVGQVFTYTLAIHNSAAVTLPFALFEGSDVYTPAALSAATEPVPILDAPFSSIAPTLDGVYAPGEWDDASRVTATRYDTPGENPSGDVWVKHTTDALYILLDFFTADPAVEWLEADICVDVDNNNSNDGGFFVIVWDGYPYFDYTYPAFLASGSGATPDHPTSHWLFELRIPLDGIGQMPGSTFGIYFAFASSGTPAGSQGGFPIQGEWPNLTQYEEYYTPHLWGDLTLALPAIPWLRVEPATGTVASGQTGAVTVTIDTTLAQPGNHVTHLHLYNQSRQPIVAEPDIPITLALAPSPAMGRLSGAVTDTRTGEPVAATLTTPDGQTAHADPATGEYVLWLEAGTWTLELAATGYLTATETATITAQTAVTRSFTLRPDAPELGLPFLSMNATLTCGQAATPMLLIANTGSQPLTFQLYETTFQDDLAVGCGSTPDVGVTEKPVWPERREPPARHPVAPLATASTATRHWEVLAFDAAIDSLGAAELLRAEAAVDETTLALRLIFDDDTLPLSVVGYVHLDTDRDATTGSRPEKLAGKPEQDIGFDYYLDLFGLPGNGTVAVWRANGTYLGELPTVFDSQAIEITVPLELLGDYDGLIDVTLALGDVNGPADWLPDAGHGTTGVGAAWLTETPAEGTVAPGEQTAVALTLDATGVQPGDYGRRLLVVSSDPLSPTVYLPLTLTVQPRATMGQLTGRVTSGQGRGIQARVSASGGPSVRSDPVTGAYNLWLEAGDWRITVEGLGTPFPLMTTFPMTIVAQTTHRQDVTLALYEYFMPSISKSARPPDLAIRREQDRSVKVSLE